LTTDPWKTTYIPCAASEQIIENCLRAVARHPRHKESQGILVIGKPGAGKSALLRALVRRTNKELGQGKNTLPAIKMSMPVPCTNRAISLAMRRALGDPAKAGSATDNFEVFTTLAHELETRLWIIDETHNMGEDKRDLSESRRHFLKRVMNEFHGLCVFAGIPAISPLLRSDEELKRRIRRVFKVESYDMSVPEQRTEYRTYLRKLDVASNMREPAEFASADRSIRIATATNGLRGITFDFIDYARDLAMDDNSPKITDEHLRRAFSESISQGDSKLKNPFDIYAPL
jgi:type II secretory pathway predicted ATPase ExeA